MSRYTAVCLLLIFAAAIGNIANANEAPGETKAPTPFTRRSVVAAVECYSCVSCPKVLDKTTKQTCPYHPDVMKLKKCIKYAEKYPVPIHGKNISWVIRGCSSERGSCEELKKAYVNNPDLDLDYCTECEGDRCNGVSRSVSDLFISFFAIIIVPFFGKSILS